MFHQPLVFFFGFGKTTRTFSPTWKTRSILDRALFLVYFLLNTLFLLFLSFLTCNCISYTFLVAVFTLIIPSTAYCLFLTTENDPLTFGAVLRSWKHQPWLCPYFQSTNYIRGYLACCFSACKYVISLVLSDFNS